jgi:iron complex outermembrane receptor protein
MDVYFMSAFTSREPRMRNLYAADDAFWDPTATPLFESVILPDSSVAYDFSKPFIKPERMLDFELGWNYSSPEFFVSADAYWMEYYDELIKSGRINIYGDPIDGNADRTRHIGLELQAGLNLLKWGDGNRLELAGNATLSHNRIIKLNFITNNKDVVDLAGNQISGFPDMIGNLRLDVFAGNLFASISGKYIGEFRSDNFGDMLTENPLIVAHLRKPDAYGEYSSYYTDNVVESSFHLNANLAYTFRNVLSLQSVKIQAQVNNILNELYAGGAEGMNFFPGAERNVFVGLEIGL